MEKYLLKMRIVLISLPLLAFYFYFSRLMWGLHVIIYRFNFKSYSLFAPSYRSVAQHASRSIYKGRFMGVHGSVKSLIRPEWPNAIIVLS